MWKEPLGDDMKVFRPELKSKMTGVFYWICPGQIWVTDSLDVAWESQGLVSRFVPWSKLGYDDFDYNEAVDDLAEVSSVSFCSYCTETLSRVQSIHFELRNDSAQPFIHRVGDAFIHSASKLQVESQGFSGLRLIPNSAVAVPSESRLKLNYWLLDANSFLYGVPGILMDGENSCPRCRSPQAACSFCGEFKSKCNECDGVLKYEESHFTDLSGNSLDGTHWPGQLSTWTLDDIVVGSNWLAVTGEFLEFLIANDIAPIAFGPINVECDGASGEQLEKAVRVRRDIRLD